MSFKAGRGFRAGWAARKHDRPYADSAGPRRCSIGLTRTWRPFSVWALELILVLAAVRSSSAPLLFREVQGHRVADLKIPAEGHAGFILMPPEVTGIWFSNTVPEARSLTNHILLNGSGVAAGDVDGDGLVDLFFSGIGGHSALYRN